MYSSLLLIVILFTGFVDPPWFSRFGFPRKIVRRAFCVQVLIVNNPHFRFLHTHTQRTYYRLWLVTIHNIVVSELGYRFMEGGANVSPGMIVLNSQNYADRKIKMEDLLIVKDLYEPIDRAEIPRG